MLEKRAATARIRAGRLADAAALVEIQRTASLAALPHIFPPEEHPFPTEAARQRWRRELRSVELTILVAEVAGQPIGMVAFAWERLDALFVVPDRWGTGLADRLHERAVFELARQGCRVCRLWVLEENHRARRFYERHRWHLDGRRMLTSFPPHPYEVGYSLGIARAT